MPEIRRWTLLAGIALIAACGGGDDGAGDPDGSLGSSGRDRAVRDEVVDSIRPTDTEPWVAETPDGDDAPNPSGTPNPPGTPNATPDAGAGAGPHPWVSGQARGGTRASGAAMLVNVRTARQDGFDRIVFEFDTHVPEWRAEYVDRPQYECGSGEAVRLEGDGWLQVNFEAANAHTEEGRPTAAPRHVANPAGANLREMRRICDFEAQVAYVLGVGSPNRYRAFQLTGPARLVVDIEQ